jgi:glucosyl-dolichyl phosphate glucuronosyltransferase
MSRYGTETALMNVPSGDTDISIVICTYNRATMLGETLISWLDVDQTGISTELVIIDNASSDATSTVVEDFKQRYNGQLTYVFEDRQGLSYARNLGIAVAAGKFIAFVDDDIYFQPDWLLHLHAAFAEHPEVAAVGGKSIPTFEVPRPSWLTNAMMRFYGSTESGDSSRRMEYPEHPFGVNMAFRREVFIEVGGFRTDLGRIGTSLLSSEEKELFFRMKEAGLSVFYAADAILLHRVPAARVEQRWVLDRAYWQGISNVIFDRHIGRNTRSTLLRSLYRSSTTLLFGDQDRALPGLYRRSDSNDMTLRLARRQLRGIIRQSILELFRRRVATPVPTVHPAHQRWYERNASLSTDD